MKSYVKSVFPKDFVVWIKKVKFRLDILLGNYVHCPICRSSFEEFQPFGIYDRANARCRNCASLERHRLIYLFLSEKSGLLEEHEEEPVLRVLHFAPEEPFYQVFSKRNNIDYIPCDLNPELYEYDEAVEIKRADITDIPFDDNTFDFILCNHVLEHIPDDGKAMSELYRVMKPGGSGIFQVPIDYDRAETYEDSTITTPAERERAFGRPDHVRYYGRDYKKKLETAGFTVSEDDFVKRLSKRKVAIYRLDPTEFIYHCRK